MTTITRRTVLKAGAATGALMLAQQSGALAAPLGPTAEFDTARSSPLFPGTRLVHADLHNHTLYSDGDGDPAKAFDSMRSAGLDAAALTDHATVAKALPPGVSNCALGECQLVGIDEARWQNTRELADKGNVDASFTAVRGFEWSSPTLGHMNVWFSETWIDPLSTNGNTTGSGLGQFLHDVPGLGPEIAGPIDAVVRATPVADLSMAPMYDWLNSDPSRPVLGGGSDAIMGFNHPGREVGRFGNFAYDARLRDRLVSMEIFNRGEDYLFEGIDASSISPLTDCLDKGWRVGLVGATDEHGTDWGYPDGKGRTGLYVRELTRAGMREAMSARRFFSTRLRGLRLGATANGAAMGSTLAHRSGPVNFVVDLDRGSASVGREVSIQVLMTGTPMPTVVHAETVAMRPAGELVRFTVPIDVEDGRWVVLRVSDPTAEADGRAPQDYRAYGNGLAYASPFYLDPEGVAAPTPSEAPDETPDEAPNQAPTSTPTPTSTPATTSTSAPTAAGSPAPSAAAGGNTGTAGGAVSAARLPTTGVSSAVGATGAALAGAAAVAARARREGGRDSSSDIGYGGPQNPL